MNPNLNYVTKVTRRRKRGKGVHNEQGTTLSHCACFFLTLTLSLLGYGVYTVNNVVKCCSWQQSPTRDVAATLYSCW